VAVYPNFIGAAYEASSRLLAADRLVNLYVETAESGTGKQPRALLSTPGTAVFATQPSSPCRALWAGDNRLFVVGGGTLFEVSSSGTVTSVGSISSDGQPAKIFSNGNQLMVITGTDVWIATGSSVVQPSFDTLASLVNTNGIEVTWASGAKFSAAMVGTTITITGLPYTVATFLSEDRVNLTASAGTQTLAAASWNDSVRGVSGAYLDGYFIILKPNSNTILVSDLYNGLGWNALDFANRNLTDRCVAIEVVNENLWVFGQKTTQVWYNSGDADFPFAPIQGATIDQGLWARFSVCNIGNSVIWLGASEAGSGVVWQAVGYQPKRISTYAIERAIQSYATSSDAIAYGYQEDGHQFYVLVFPTAEKTWVYDVTEGLWHERAYYSSAGGGDSLRAVQGWYHASTFGGKNFVASGTSGKIFEMSRQIYADDGRPIRRIRVAPHLSDENKWLFHHRLRLDMEGGVQASAPDVSLAISNDGGQTFGSDLTLTAGAAGDFTKRVEWRRLGRSRDRVYRIQTESAGPHSWIGAYIEVEEGTGA
jgi:hypothetical protein